MISIASHASLRYHGTECAYDIAQTPPDFILMEHAVSDYRKKRPYTHRVSSPCNVIRVINDWPTGRHRSSAHPSLPPRHCRVVAETIPAPLSKSDHHIISSYHILFAHSRSSPLRPPSLLLAFLLSLRVTRYRDTNCFDNRCGFSAMT